MQLSRKDFLRLAVAATTAGPLASAEVVQSSGLQQRSGERNAPPPQKARRRPGTAGVTPDVVRFIASANIDQFPSDVISQAKRCLIDGFGVVLAGTTLHGSRIVRDYVKAASAASEATVFGGSRLKTRVEFAALANGASGHAMDFDDTQLSTTPDRTFGLLTHPTVPALASALAISES